MYKLIINNYVMQSSTSTQVVTVTENVKFSQSALSAAACFKRVSIHSPLKCVYLIFTFIF